MATSISVSAEIKNKLLIMKIEEGYPNIDVLLRDMILWYKKQRILEVSKKFRGRMDKRKYKPQDLIE
ncbi:MAG: hypothetical protein AB1779_10650 [Candidatus Thermoplasmatota archaeon]